MIGSFAVGKSSLVKRFVHESFTGEYYTTVGVKIDRKTIQIQDQTIDFILWDLNGEDAFQSVQMSYLRGMHGYFLVIDGTRKSTVDVAMQLDHKIQEAFGPTPRICALNKKDLLSEWDLDESAALSLTLPERPVIHTSASSGEGVEELFHQMGSLLLADS